MFVRIYKVTVCFCLLILYLCSCQQQTNNLQDTFHPTTSLFTVTITAEEPSVSHPTTDGHNETAEKEITETIPPEIMASLLESPTSSVIPTTRVSHKNHIVYWDRVSSSLLFGLEYLYTDETWIQFPELFEKTNWIDKIDWERLQNITIHDIIMPNAKTWIFGNSAEHIAFMEGERDLARIETIVLPANIRSINTANQSGGLPHEFVNLSSIEIADGGSAFCQVRDGVLFGTGQFGANYPFDEYLYCIPQNYFSETGTYVIPEQTKYINHNAVYHCRNIKTLVIPDSVIFLCEDAIIATAEYPLTVVCSRGSAAEKYVTRFGDMYHLILQVTE